MKSWLLKCLAAVMLLACTLPSECFAPDQFISLNRFLDDSWRYDLTEALRHGQVSGRDIIFNYGPLRQLLHGLGLLVPPGDLATVIRWHDVLEALWIVGACAYLARSSGAPGGVSGFFLFAWAIVQAAPGDFRATWFKPMGGMLPVALGAGWLCSSAAATRWPRQSTAAAIVWGLAPAVMSSYSFEMGPLTLLGQAVAAAAIWCCGWGSNDAAVVARGRRAMFMAAWSVVATAAIALAIYLHPIGRVYLVENISLVQSYPKSWAHGGSLWHLALLMLPIPLALGSIALAVVAIRQQDLNRTASDAPPAAWGSLIGAAAYSLLLVRYGLTRSDIYHVWIAIAPSIFVASVLLPCQLWTWRTAAADSSRDERFHSPHVWLRRLAIGLPLVLLAPWAMARTFSIGWNNRALELAHFSLAPARFSAVDPMIQAAVDRVRPLAEPDLVVWPYGALINALAGKRNPLPTIHPIESHNATLADHTLRVLHEKPNVPVLLFTGGIDPDLVPNVTRTAPVFRNLLENYQLQLPIEPGHALLLPRRESAPWVEREAAIEPCSFEPDGQRAVSVALPDNACRASDLLLLKLRIAPTMMLGFRKPGRVIVVMVLDDGSHIVRLLPTPSDGQPYESLLTGADLDDPLLLAMFATERGRLVAQQRVKQLLVGWRPLDLLSARPAKIEVLGLSVLEPATPAAPVAAPAEPLTEISLADRWSPAVWRKFFHQSPPRRSAAVQPQP